TIWDQGGHRWEAAPWLPGTADYEVDPRPERLRAAMRALAEFHVIAAKCEPTDESQPSPGVQQRHSQLRTWLGGRLDSLVPHVAFPDSTGNSAPPSKGAPLASEDELPAVARQILACVPAVAQNILASLTSSLTIRVPLQPCLRDVWHDHVLFQGDSVTGLIDYGAMRRETVAADIARLLGSFVGDDAQGWQIGLDEYHSVRPLSPAERSLVATFDLSSVVLAPLNWLQWLYLDGRVFEDRAALLKRLRGWAGRLRRLTERMERQFHIPSGRISP
ncbi:MAG TPA: phosphotransferase, partial [Pirellulaceae bacterium]|nr:phosphotransferase [Pirellulaceae bacterium]